MPSIPDAVLSGGGRIYFVADPDADPPTLWVNYAQMERTCVIGGCLTVFAPLPGFGPPR